MFDPFGLNNHINSIINSMMTDPFAPPGQQRNRQQPNASSNGGQLRPFDPFSSMAISPFDHHRSSPFSLMNHMMGNMDSLFRPTFSDPFNGVINADPNSEVFSSSSVITYSSGGEGGRPKVFQQSKQMRQGPGGVKETREMVRDSERGIEQMAIGHHIGDRAHIIERKKNREGQIEELVNLENIDDEEVTDFNREFEERIGAQFRSAQHGHHGHHHHRTHHHLNNNQPLAIDDGGQRSKKDKDRKTKSTKH